MSDPYAIRIHEVSKAYQIYKKPVDRLLEIITRRTYHEKFNALQTLSLDIKVGETVGVIGTNGSGKSTLLKLLAGTLTPSSGTIEVQGRLAALLELGAGFHPEFTGRKNIFLNAALLGLTTEEIKEKEQEIIEFSELNEFIDRPVRTYSSGMTVRLGFAVVACINPVVLIVDEALSVGDQAFQEKCIKKILELQQNGTTLFLCTHSLPLVQELCHHAIWLDKGVLMAQGDSLHVVSKYLNTSERRQIEKNNAPTANDKSATLAIKAKVLDKDGKEETLFDAKSPMTVELHLQNFSTPETVHFIVGLYGSNDDLLFIFRSKDHIQSGVHLKDKCCFKLMIEQLRFLKGTYQLRAAILDESGYVGQVMSSALFIDIKASEAAGRFALDYDWVLE